MTDTEIFEKQENMPLESYTFTYTSEEYDEAVRGVLQGYTVRTVVTGILFAAITAGVIMSDITDFFDGFLVGWTLIYFLMSLAGLLTTRKNWKSTKAKVCSSENKYELFDDYLLFTVTRDGKCVHFTKLEYDKLRRKMDTGRMYLLDFANQGYLIKKQEIAENSIFHTLKPKPPEKPKKALKVLSVVFMALTIVTLVCAIISALLVNINSVGIVNYWWYLYIFLPIPLFSCVLGAVLKRNHNSGRGNMIMGLLAIILVVCVYFSFNNIAKENMYPDKQQNISAIESYIDVDLPNPYAYDNFTDSVNGIDYEDTAMQFYGSDVGWLESAIKSSDYWLADFTDDTYELVKDVGTAEDWDYFIVYNITEGEYNKLPVESGVYSMAAVYYDMDFHGMYVIEYAYVQYEQ